MSRTSLELNTCHATNTAPWLFSDPYAYQYADIPNHIRQISSTARQAPHNTTKDGHQLSVTTAVEAGSVPIFEMEGCTPTTPRVNVVGVENAEVASGLRFELEDSSSHDGSYLANGLARLTITPSVTAQSSLPSSLTPGCLHIGGGSGIKSPSTPTTPSASAGLLRRSTATRAPGSGGGSRRASRVVTTAPPPAAIAEAHNRLETPPPPYAPATISPQERLSYLHHQQQAPLSALPSHLRHHKRQSCSVSLSSSVPISPCATTPTTPTSPASDLDSILRNIKEDRRRARDSVLIMEAEESRRGSRGSRAYAKYCDNN
ncbi:hypothetical protein PG989_006633 [Apiospora arundinis]